MKFLHCRFLLCSSMKTFTMSRSSGAVNFGCGSGRATAVQGCTHGGAWPRRGCCGRREGRRHGLLPLHGRPRSTERRQRRRAAAAHGGAAPSAAAGVAATSGSERGSKSGDGDEAKLRGRAPAAGARGRAPAAGWLLIFFVCQKCFGSGWSFQPVPMNV